MISDSTNPFAHQTTSPSYLESIDRAAQDPSWPPLPTMGGTAGERPNLEGERIDLRPRSTKIPGRRADAAEQPAPAEGIPAPQETKKDQAFHARKSETLEFPCPSCGMTLATILGNDNSTPGPCPHCEASIVAPHVVVASAKQSVSEAKSPQKKIYRPDRSKALNAPRPSRTIVQ